MMSINLEEKILLCEFYFLGGMAAMGYTEDIIQSSVGLLTSDQEP